VKKILILTVSFGEGHNSAARGIRDGLVRFAPAADVEVHDLFAETYGWINALTRKAYLAVINRRPTAWGPVYRWLDGKTSFEKDFARFTSLKKHFSALLSRFQPDVVVSVFPAYPYLLQQLEPARARAPQKATKSVVVITDSITVNAIWYRCPANYFLVPNPQSATVVQAGGIAPEMIKTFGFPVNPKFADLAQDRVILSDQALPRVLYMINAGTRRAPKLVQRLLSLNIELTVTVGRDEKLRHATEAAAGTQKVKILGWTDDLPRLLCENHLLIGKAGGATVQEAIAAGCPMIINHIVSGQEEGNAELIIETNSGTVAQSPHEVAIQVEQAFADGAKKWREWKSNITRISRPRASLEIAEFLLSI